MSEQPILSEADRAALIEQARQAALGAAGLSQPVTPEQAAAALAAATPQAQAGPAPASVDALTAARAQAGQSPVGATLPAEDAMNALMDQIKAQSDLLEAALKRVGQLEQNVRATAAGIAEAAGEPFIVRYAKGARDKILSHAVANPDLGAVIVAPQPDGTVVHQVTGHYGEITKVLNGMVVAAEAAAHGTGAPEDVAKAAATALRFLNSGHRRATHKYVDHSAAADDLEQVQDEAAKLSTAA